ncbi:TPA_asm: EO4 [Tilapia adomavirus 2]|uniref:EO4 n=1 Tax=Tilapia adomavirus 2 TaxID=2597804 RepID=A0A5H3CQH5_9VIRU|nr:TPA_asm: EO4 [Tilapia adomavirus 2]
MIYAYISSFFFCILTFIMYLYVLLEHRGKGFSDPQVVFYSIIVALQLMVLCVFLCVTVRKMVNDRARIRSLTNELNALKTHNARLTATDNPLYVESPVVGGYVQANTSRSDPRLVTVSYTNEQVSRSWS